MKRSLERKPEDGGSWFVLGVDPTPVILNRTGVAIASEAYDGDLVRALKEDGYTPFADDNGNWIAWMLRDDIYPTYIPDSLKHVAEFVAAGTVVTMDNGCFPSLEWRFDGKNIVVFDTYDYLDGTPNEDSG